MIIAENIHKFYENNHILKGINLRVDKGEIISLVGASGAGKTTLLQILGTIDKFDKKEDSKLLLKNQDISDFTENQLANFRNHEIGFIFQFHQLYSFPPTHLLFPFFYQQWLGLHLIF